MTSGLRSRAETRVVYESPLRRRVAGTPFLAESAHRPRRRRAPFALAGILLLAAANFLWQLATPSYFADEVLSIWNVTPSSLSHVITSVNKTEANPWTYFLFLHAWLKNTGTQDEWVMRLSSVIVGLALVAAVYWLARAFLSQRAALAAAALCAFSPVVLQYAQEVRGYIFVMLAVPLAVAATIRAVDRHTARNALLLVGALAAVSAMLLHYFAVLVIAPLCIWLLLQRSLPRLQRGLYVAVCAIAGGLTIPLFVEQYNNAGGLAGVASLKWSTAAAVVGTPFDGRFPQLPVALRILGVVVAVVSVLRLLKYTGPALRHARLLGTLGLVPLATLLVLGVFGVDVVATRYSALAAPIEIVVILAAIATFSAPAAIALAAATALVAAWGIAASHSLEGFYPPAKQTMTYIGRHRQVGDIVALSMRQGVHWAFQYYGRRLIHPQPPYINPGDSRTLITVLRQRRRVWIVNLLPANEYTHRALRRLATRRLRPFGYRPLSFHTVTTSATAIIYLAAPAA
jgi:4-amino-4-deoxy-L-arabinose transferase-like glycosyltransferase